MRLAGSAGDWEGESRERKPKMLSEGEAKDSLKILQEAGRVGGLNKHPKAPSLPEKGGPIPMRGGGKGCC